MILNDFCGLGIEKIVENHEKTEADIFFSEALKSRDLQKTEADIFF